MRRDYKWLLAPAVVVLALVGIGSGCSGSSDSSSNGGGSSSAQALHKVGDEVSSNDGKKLKVVSADLNYKSANAFPQTGKKCVAVVLDLTNGSKDTWTGIDINISVIDENGVKADFGSGIGCGAPPGSDTLTPGGHETSTVAFAVNSTAKTFKLEWQPSLFDTEKFDFTLS